MRNTVVLIIAAFLFLVVTTTILAEEPCHDNCDNNGSSIAGRGILAADFGYQKYFDRMGPDLLLDLEGRVEYTVGEHLEGYVDPFGKNPALSLQLGFGGGKDLKLVGSFSLGYAGIGAFAFGSRGSLDYTSPQKFLRFGTIGQAWFSSSAPSVRAWMDFYARMYPGSHRKAGFGLVLTVYKQNAENRVWREAGNPCSYGRGDGWWAIGPQFEYIFISHRYNEEICKWMSFYAQLQIGGMTGQQAHMLSYDLGTSNPDSRTFVLLQSGIKFIF